MSLPDGAARTDRTRPDPSAEQAEILALVAPLRRFALSRLRDVHDADDVVQETLTRVLAVRGRLEDETLTAYAFAVARNLVANQHREADLGRRHAPRLVDEREPAQPEHLVLAAEDRRALAAALGELPQPQRDQLVEHVVHDVAVGDLDSGSRAGAVAAQLARTRARLRLDYVLALRGATLPTPRCRPVLLAVSAGDRRRQGALRASDHLSTCRTCGELSEPLLRRRRALAGVAPWIALGTWHGKLVAWVRGHPAASATSAAAGVAAVAVAVAALASGPPAPAPAAAPAPAPAAVGATPSATSPSPTPADATLTGPDGPVLPAAGNLARLAGQQVRARGVRVVAVPADEGFWVGDGTGRVWVQLRTRRESGEQVRPGQRLSFSGVVVRHDAGFARRAGVNETEGATELTRQGAHVEIGAGGFEVD